jgi:hypothetical protein
MQHCGNNGKVKAPADLRCEPRIDDRAEVDVASHPIASERKTLLTDVDADQLVDSGGSCEKEQCLTRTAAQVDQRSALPGSLRDRRCGKPEPRVAVVWYAIVEVRDGFCVVQGRRGWFGGLSRYRLVLRLRMGRLHAV